MTAGLTSLTNIVKNGIELDDAVTIILTDLGVIYDGWQDVTISRALTQLSGSFSISLIDKWRENKLPWFLKPGTKVIVRIGQTPVINGFIDRLDVDISNEDRRVEITGRDLTGDLVDSSAPTEPAEFKNVSILTLAQKFCLPFGISVLTDVDINPVFPKFTVKQGETIFELLQRAANLRGLLLIATDLGQLLITNRSSVASQTRSPTPLVQGSNIIEARASYDNSDRFQTYFAKGQSEGNDIVNGLNVTSPLGIALDSNILRPREKTVIADGSVDFATVQKRANWESSVRAAKSVDVSVKVQGWRQTTLGPLWSINQLVAVDAGFLGVQSQELLITGLEFSKTLSDGTVTNLNLTRSDAFDPQPALNPVKDPQETLGWKQEVFKILEGN
jgi:prophage tail gpP-like protein